MNIEEIRDYCLVKKGVTECMPFDEDTLVFKVADKMFLLLNLSGNLELNLKCDPERAVELREKHSCITPGYHMNKTHWNTVKIDGSLPDKFIMSLIDHSYDLVFTSLSRKKKEAI